MATAGPAANKAFGKDERRIAGSGGYPTKAASMTLAANTSMRRVWM